MKNRIFRFAMLCMSFAVPVVGLSHTSAETNHLVWALLARARPHFDNVADPENVYITPDFGNPDVFFSMRTDASWTRAEKEFAFNAFLESMYQIDFGSDCQIGKVGVPNPFAAVSQCLEMKYTNAVPAIRRLALNPTLQGPYRRKVLNQCIALAPVNDDMTRFIEVFLTNRTTYTWRDRRVAFDYVDKVMSSSASNLVPRVVINRAVLMFYNARIDDDWEYVATLDSFLSAYDSDYAVSPPFHIRPSFELFLPR